MSNQTKFKNLLLSIFVLGAAFFIGIALPTPEAQALNKSLKVDSFEFDCGTSILPIVPPTGIASGGYASISCENVNTGAVAYGGDDVALTTAKTICNDAACVRPDFGMDVNRVWCIAATTIEIRCEAGVY